MKDVTYFDDLFEAGSERTSSERLIELAKHEDPDVRAAVGRNLVAPAEALALVLQRDGRDGHEDPKLCKLIASHPKTSSESLLALLAQDN